MISWLLQLIREMLTASKLTQNIQMIIILLEAVTLKSTKPRDWFQKYWVKKDLRLTPQRQKSLKSPEIAINDWKKCKVPGRSLDREHHIKRRHGLATSTYKFEKIFKNYSTNQDTKLKVLNSYVESIFLYDSELWVLTKKNLWSNQLCSKKVPDKNPISTLVESDEQWQIVWKNQARALGQ